MNYLSLLEAASFRPDRLVFPDSWIGHIPFAAWLIKTVTPSIFVELGTHSGNSYLAFCQAVKETSLSTSCYAIDTWKGDEQAGFYGEEIFNDLNAYHFAHYAEFSRLMRMTFDEGSTYFADGSIDLLHIDGLHTYEAVRHDFETWLPKLTHDAIVVFHDTNVRQSGFGVWQYWGELCQQYPLHLEFLHSNGLGVLAVSNNPESSISKWIQMWAEESHILRGFFASLGQSLLESYNFTEQRKNKDEQLIEREQTIQTLKAQAVEREQTIQTLNAQAVEREQTIQTLKAQAVEREQTIQTLKAQAVEREQTIQTLNAQAAKCNEMLQSMNSENVRYATSKSWKYTRPFRRLSGFFKRVQK